MGDEYEEDFEDYDDDDFEEEGEEEEAPPPPPPKKPVAPPPEKSTKVPSPKTPSPKTTKSPGKSKTKQEDPATPKNLPDHVLETRRAMHEENQKISRSPPPGRDKGKLQQMRQSVQRSSYSPERLRPRTATKKDPEEEEEASGPIPSYSGGGGRTFVEPSLGADGKVVLKRDTSGVGKVRKQRLQKHCVLCFRFKDLIKSGKVTLASTETVMMLEMKPMSEYDLFARGFSRVDKESTECQVPDDDRQRIAETQSDPITKSNAGIQFPDDMGVRSTYEKVQYRENVRQSGGGDSVGVMGYDSSRLASFLLRVEPVVTSVLEETARETFSRQSSLKRFGDEVLKDSATSFSSTSTSFTAPFKDVLKGRVITRIVVVGGSSGYIAVCYGPKLDASDPEGGGSVEGADLHALGLLCLWKKSDPDTPAHALATHLTPSAFSFSPLAAAPLCVLGSREGILSVWDLRETSTAASPFYRKSTSLLSDANVGVEEELAAPSTGPKWRLANYTTTYSNPTSIEVQIQPTGYYSGDDDDGPRDSRKTGGKSRNRAGAMADLHIAPVVEVRMIVSGERGGRSDDSLGVQVVSLDEEGKLLFWSVIALQDDDDDIFLSYGGRLKLLRVASSSIHKDASMNQREKSWTLPLARCLCEHPLDSNFYFVGLENGEVLQRARYGKVTGPAKYRVHGYQADLGDATSDLGLHGFDSSGGVTSIAVSSCSELAPDATALLMLVGREDGSVSLFSTSTPSPIRVWNGFAMGAVVRVCWSPTRPSVFIVLDSTSRLYFFTLLDKATDGPVQVEHVDSSHVLEMDVGAENKGTSKQRTSLAVAFKSGHIQVHELKSKFSEPMSKEEEEVKQMITSWM